MKLRYLLPLLLLLAACSDEPKVNAQWGTPEYIASEFLNALYNERDLDKAKKLSTKEFAELMQSYGTVRQVSRTLVNASFDTVDIRVNRSGGNLREQYEDIAKIALLLTGIHDGKQIDELRTVELIKQNNRWVVSAVQIDKYSSSAR
ncbi:MULTISPECIES: hypothetical protein [Rheinheimera]|uniref:hypothetical protein n=1 Tax=Rheinheimera TaxID=67575 RepID=UPI00104BBFB8|nr:hypothetical protein [Rheinheimera sp. D18]QBL09547.1 hypothetical protein E0Z06_08500 [Rheinheimera sp. D18]